MAKKEEKKEIKKEVKKEQEATKKIVIIGRRRYEVK